MIKLPQNLLETKHLHPSINLNGCTVIESCLYEDELKDCAYLSEHELIYLFSGKLIIWDEQEEVTVNPGETILVKKGTYFDFMKKSTGMHQHYKSILFFFKNEFITEFLNNHQLDIPKPSQPLVEYFKIEANPVLEGFIASLMPYFKHPIGDKEQLFRLKTFEVLLHLSESNPQAFAHFFHQPKPMKSDLVNVMEKHFTKNIALEDFAQLSGRSLATFKRDFQKVFKTSPAKWLRQKRLELAHYLLKNTYKRPSEIYLEIGFEDFAHFSRAFKAHFGYSPSSLK